MPARHSTDIQHLVLGRLLVDISLGVVGRLVHLVSDGVLGSGGTGGEGCVRVLSDLCEDVS